MKNQILLLLLFSFIFIFVGCTPKTQIVFKDKIVCVDQKKLDEISPVKIRIHNDDVNVAAAYVESIHSSFSFYENQVDRNNKFCKEMAHGKD